MKNLINIVLVIIMILSIASCKQSPQTMPSSTESIPLTVQSVVSETSNVDETSSETISDVSTPTASSQAESTITSSVVSQPNSEPTPTVSENEVPTSTPTTSSSTLAPTTQLPTTVTTTLGTVPIGTTVDVTSPEEYVTLVEEAKKYGGVRSPYANVGTGISWDGVTPIVYTYEDGSTGYEPREGAKYEVYPGLIGRVYLSICFCSECGKTSGNGTNGTCVQWLMGDIDCPNCGQHVEVRTCHTCSE